MPKTKSVPPVQAYKTKHPLARELAKIAVSVALIACGVGLAFFLNSLKEAPPTKESTALIQQVATSRIEPYSGLLSVEVSGSVVPHREIKVAAEVAGRIVKRYSACENGMFVSEGEPLLEIDREAYELELRTLEADVVQSQRRIEENEQQIIGEERNIELAKGDLALQQQELDRNRRISNALSKSELEQSTRAYNAARMQLTTRENNLNTLKAGSQRLEAALELSRQQIEKAKLNLRRTTIVAPADGVIVRALIQEGDYVSAGTLVVIFEDTSQAEVLVNLTPGELSWIRQHSKNADSLAVAPDKTFRSVYKIPRTEVTVFDPIDPSISWSGVLDRFDGIGRDDVTKTIPCRIRIAQPIVEDAKGLHALVRGMFVKCRMDVHVTSGETNLFSVPEVALHPDGCVWVVRSDATLQQIKVDIVNRVVAEPGTAKPSFVVVRSKGESLQVGDFVVVSPLSQPFSGMPVLIESKPSVPLELE